MRTRHTSLVVSLLVLALLASCVSAPVVNPSGVKRVDFDRIDDLLVLPDNPRTGVLVIDSNDPGRVSSVHVQRLREFLNQGGVVWVAGDGLDSALVRDLTRFEVQDYTYRKATSRKPGGELIVRGASPNLVIEDHPLTEGVRELYLFPRRSFEGAPGLQPLVRMTDADGNTGTVIAAVPVGRGFLVLDGTARDERLLFSRLPGFNERRPNAVELESGWTDYDWDRLLENASRHSSS